jgi:hypothetical protein
LPMATALMPTDAWRLVLMSMEPDPSLNRFLWPEKPIGSGFPERVLLNVGIDRSPPGYSIHESRIGISAPPRDN